MLNELLENKIQNIHKHNGCNKAITSHNCFTSGAYPEGRALGAWAPGSLNGRQKRRKGKEKERKNEGKKGKKEKGKST